MAAVVINYTLGGFKEIQPGLVTTGKTVIYGKEYQGSYNSEVLDELLAELRGEIAESSSAGQLTIVNYHQDDLEKRGMVKQFVGIVWSDSQKILGYDSLVIEEYNGAQFRIPVKPLVMPSPEKLKSLAEEMAENMTASLAGYSIEQYQDKTLVINFPFKSVD